MPEKKVRKKNGATGTNKDLRLSIIMNGRGDTRRKPKKHQNVMTKVAENTFQEILQAKRKDNHRINRLISFVYSDINGMPIEHENYPGFSWAIEQIGDWADDITPIWVNEEDHVREYDSGDVFRVLGLGTYK